MIRHYLTTILAAVRKAPLTTAANILVLALGLASFLAALGIVSYWRSFDMHHANADRTFALGQAYLPKSGQLITTQSIGSMAPARYLKADFPEIERVARVSGRNNKIPVSANSRKLLVDAVFAEPDFLSIFDLKFLAGDPRRALNEPGSVLITKATAEKLFGNTPALGQHLTIGGKTDATVTGVIAPTDKPSFMGDRPDASLKFDLMATWRLSPDIAELDGGNEEWFSAQGLTVFQLKRGANLAGLNARLPAFVDRHMPRQQRELVDITLTAFPINELVTLGMDNDLFARNGLKLTTVGVLLALGLLILITAGLNYANLATAQATLAAKQIGLHKVLGASRAEIMVQSWLASLGQTLAALLLAVATLAIAAPAVRSSLGIDILYFLNKPLSAALLITALVVFVTLAAGAYPALAMSGVRPAQALQSGRSRTGPKFVARLLVGMQFAIAGFLMILLSVSFMQRRHLEEVALAPRSDPIVILNELQAVGVDGQTLVAALKTVPGVKQATATERLPWTTSGSFVPLVKTPEAGAQESTVMLKHIGYDYFDTLGFKLKAGRVFDRAHETVSRSLKGATPANPLPAILDETLARNMGFASPQAAVGETIYASASVMRIAGGSGPQPIEIVGVTEADTTWMGASLAKGSLYLFGPDSPLGNGLYPILRLEKSNLRQTLAGITHTWDQFAPTTPADIRFFDQMFEDNYKRFGRMAQLFTLLADIALTIAALGLLGIAVHVASRRRHEIAVRKTLGSTTVEAMGLLLADFSKPVIIANLIVWPLGYLAARAYLSAFSSQITLTAWPFVLSLAVSLIIAWIVVAGQTFKAARVSPAQALRDQ